MELNRAQRDYMKADYAARKEVYEKYNKSRKVENAAFFVGLPIAAGLAAGATHGYTINSKGKIGKNIATVSQKFKAGAMRTKWWGVMGLGVIAGAGIVKALTNSIKPLKEFKKEHPGATTLGALVGIFAAASAANPVVDKAAKLIGKIHIGKSAKTIGERVSGKFADVAAKLDNPKGNKSFGRAFNKKVFNPLGNFLAKNKVGRGLYAYAPYLLLGGIIGKHVVDSDKIKRDVKNKRNAILAQNYIGTPASNRVG